MFGDIGIQELALIFVVVLLLFGARRLPEIGASLGRGMRELQRGLSGADAPEDGPAESTAMASAPLAGSPPAGAPAEARSGAPPAPATARASGPEDGPRRLLG